MLQVWYDLTIFEKPKNKWLQPTRAGLAWQQETSIKLNTNTTETNLHGLQDQFVVFCLFVAPYK